MDKVARESMVGRTQESVFTFVCSYIKKMAKGITLDQIQYMKERMEPATLRITDNKRLLEKEDKLERLTDQAGFVIFGARADDQVQDW